MIGVVIVLAVTELCFLAVIQFPFDNVEWNDGTAYCACGIGSAAMAAIAFGLTCALTSFMPIIVSMVGAAIGYVSIHVRLLFIRLQERKLRQSRQDEITICYGGPLLHRALNMPHSECPGIISDEEEEEEYESVF